MFSINKTSTILFLGIGGVSMFQLALAFKQLGYNVLGYDETLSERTKLCEDGGIKVFNKFNKQMLKASVCVKTAAIKDNSKIVKMLKEVDCKIFDRAEALSFLTNKFKLVIAVAGTHGKTTTSTLIYELLKAGGKKVSCHIGADLKDARFNLKDDIIVVEACEYNKSFLTLTPTVAVVTNVEAEHLDSYGNLFNLKNAFISFLKSGKQRYVYLEKSTKFLKKIGGVNFVDNYILNFYTQKANEGNLKFNPILKGEYNFKNMALAVSVAKDFGIEDKAILDCVNNFLGVPRRNEFVGCFNNAKVFVDYAHHPTEVKAFLEMFCLEHKDSTIVFQPHTYSRTKNFLKEFVETLKKYKVIIYKEYPARETKDMGITARQLYEKIKELGGRVCYSSTIKQLKKQLAGAKSIAFVGAGNINKVAEVLVKQDV